jgi:hypothetical protein
MMDGLILAPLPPDSMYDCTIKYIYNEYTSHDAPFGIG